MKCAACGTRWSADVGSTGPGGFSAPGVFLLAALVLAMVAGGCFMAGTMLWAAAFGLFAVLALLAVGLSMSDAKRTGGGECPNCASRAPIRPWSL